MRRRVFLGSMIYTLAIILVLLPLVSCSTQPSATSPTASPDADQETATGNVIAQANAGASTPEVIVPLATQETSLNDARLILENTCSHCHLVQSLLDHKKSRQAWEGVLQQMESMGVEISENEKVILIDYLATAQK